jgi:hypothetical protein
MAPRKDPKKRKAATEIAAAANHAKTQKAGRECQVGSGKHRTGGQGNRNLTMSSNKKVEAKKAASSTSVVVRSLKSNKKVDSRVESGDSQRRSRQTAKEKSDRGHRESEFVNEEETNKGEEEEVENNGIARDSDYGNDDVEVGYGENEDKNGESEDEDVDAESNCDDQNNAGDSDDEDGEAEELFKKDNPRESDEDEDEGKGIDGKENGEDDSDDDDDEAEGDADIARVEDTGELDEDEEEEGDDGTGDDGREVEDSENGEMPNAKPLVEYALQPHHMCLLKRVLKMQTFARIKFANELDLRDMAMNIGVNNLGLRKKKIHHFVESIASKMRTETSILRCGILRSAKTKFLSKCICEESETVM